MWVLLAKNATGVAESLAQKSAKIREIAPKVLREAPKWVAKGPQSRLPPLHARGDRTPGRLGGSLPSF